jgi:AraC-like DNA-binding protein
LSLQSLLESVLGRPVEEARFEFPYPQPEYARLFKDLFHAPVHFKCREFACVIPATWLSVASPFSDPSMHRILVQQLHSSARHLHGDRLLVARVEQILAQRGARLGMRQAARLIGISDRTLVRRLTSQRTSFHALVDSALKSRAVALLHDERLAIQEVAYVLGYTDAANFGRAFRRWFDMSPGRYRAMIDGVDLVGDGLC